MLNQYDPNIPYYFGHRYVVNELKKGYMAGGGYILSKQALKNFVDALDNNRENCHNYGTIEDWEMGSCLANNATFIEDLDERNQKRFFPISIEEHLKSKKKVNYNWWYRERMYFDIEQGSLNCCSEFPVSFHYIPPRIMYLFEYFIYQVNPFGIDDSKYRN